MCAQKRLLKTGEVLGVQMSALLHAGNKRPEHHEKAELVRPAPPHVPRTPVRNASCVTCRDGSSCRS
jgi:hypothetical protein